MKILYSNLVEFCKSKPLPSTSYCTTITIKVTVDKLHSIAKRKSNSYYTADQFVLKELPAALSVPP